ETSVWHSRFCPQARISGVVHMVHRPRLSVATSNVTMVKAVTAKTPKKKVRGQARPHDLDRMAGMAAQDREKALDTALVQIERQFGKGAVMRLGQEGRAPIEVIPTGAIALDAALGIGGLPRGRVVEI